MQTLHWLYVAWRISKHLPGMFLSPQNSAVSLLEAGFQRSTVTKFRLGNELPTGKVGIKGALMSTSDFTEPPHTGTKHPVQRHQKLQPRQQGGSLPTLPASWDSSCLVASVGLVWAYSSRPWYIHLQFLLDLMDSCDMCLSYVLLRAWQV